MSRSIRILSAAILLCLLSLPALAQSGLVRGTVTDSEDNPLEGVTVTITSETLPDFNEVLTTDKKGKFTIRFPMVQHTYDFLFEKNGFQSFVQPLSPSATRQSRETFVMEVSEAQVVQKQGDLGSVVTGTTNTAITAFNSGLDAQKAGDLDTARAKLEEAIAADDSLGPAHVALAQVLLDSKQYEAAVASADRALGLPVNRTEALKVKYYALRALGRAEEADAVSNELGLAEDAVAQAKRIYNEGGQAFTANDHDTALARFQEAASLDPSLREAHHAIATLLLGKGEHEAAAEAAKKALSLGSDNVDTLRVLYDAYDALGRIDDLTEIAPRLAAVDPEFGGSKLLEQAGALWNGGQTAQAVALAKQALAIDPSLAKAHYFIGLDHLSKGENAEAKANLEKFIALAPEDGEAATAKEMLTYIE